MIKPNVRNVTPYPKDLVLKGKKWRLSAYFENQIGICLIFYVY